VAAPSASGGLGQKLERALSGAKIRKAETNVGGDNTDQSHVRDVVALGNHLRADQNVEIAFAKTLQDGFEVALAAYRIAIHASDSRGWKIAMQLFFHFFRSRADEVHILAAALRANRGHLLGIVAVVAEHAAVAPMVSERDRAVDAFHALAAGATGG